MIRELQYTIVTNESQFVIVNLVLKIASDLMLMYRSCIPLTSQSLDLCTQPNGRTHWIWYHENHCKIFWTFWSEKKAQVISNLAVIFYPIWILVEIMIKHGKCIIRPCTVVSHLLWKVLEFSGELLLYDKCDIVYVFNTQLRLYCWLCHCDSSGVLINNKLVVLQSDE